MVSEFDLPCAECNSQLEPKELQTATTPDGPLTVAHCPECGSQYYPESTLKRI